jgi:superfamily II DNA or RNA helicase
MVMAEQGRNRTKGLPMDEDLISNIDAEPRPYQLRIAEKAIHMFEGRYVNRAGQRERAARSVLIESPTGSGKTIVGLMLARWIQQNWGYRVGWVAMRRNLLAQAAEENHRRDFNVDMRLISMFDKAPPKVDLLVVDEAQHDAAMSMANLHGMIRPEKILGLSATPYRTDRVKLCFERVIRDADIHHLIQDGYLSQYHHYTVDNYTPESVAECYARDPDRWGKSLIFFHRLRKCEQCHHLLSRLGIRGEVVTANTNRERQIEDFAAGKVQVLFSMAILAEGFDCPSLKTVFCRPSGKSCTIQMGGRVFRQHPGLPFKQIVQCRDTRHPFPRTASPAEQYVWMSGGWKTLKMNRHLAAISANALKVIATSNATLPKLLTQNRSRGGPWWQRRQEQLDTIGTHE